MILQNSIFHLVWTLLMMLILLVIIRRGPASKPKRNSDQASSFQLWVGEETDKKIGVLVLISLLYSILVLTRNLQFIYN